MNTPTGTDLIPAFRAVLKEQRASGWGDTDAFVARLNAAGITDDALRAAGLAVCGRCLVVAAATVQTIVATLD